MTLKHTTPATTTTTIAAAAIAAVAAIAAIAAVSTTTTTPPGSAEITHINSDGTYDLQDLDTDELHEFVGEGRVAANSYAAK